MESNSVFLTDTDAQRLVDLEQIIAISNHNSIGYPISKDFDFSEVMPFLKYPINNVGDPFENSINKVKTHELEREVVGFFAKLFRADPNNYWGYVTNGGSESNLYGLYLARELYPKGMVYYSANVALFRIKISIFVII